MRARFHIDMCGPLRGTLRHAIRLPSGENRGDTSGPGPVVNWRSELPARSISQISKLRLMLKRTDSRSAVRLAWTAIVLPSGDQLGSPYHVSPGVSLSTLLAAKSFD